MAGEVQSDQIVLNVEGVTGTPPTNPAGKMTATADAERESRNSVWLTHEAVASVLENHLRDADREAWRIFRACC